MTGVGVGVAEAAWTRRAVRHLPVVLHDLLDDLVLLVVEDA